MLQTYVFPPTNYAVLHTIHFNTALTTILYYILVNVYKATLTFMHTRNSNRKTYNSSYGYIQLKFVAYDNAT